MSAKTVSPTANLLRSSRFFSMPRPLPLPSNELAGHIQSQRTSDTATLPYPIQQVVTTTPSSLARGDWGLKRPLPLRSTTRTSTPIFRINAIDTSEHITDFDSASDLALNLKRIQELNLSVTTKPPKTRKSGMPQRANVFENLLDRTLPTDDPSEQRWKFKGPWVAGMTEGDFEAYVKTELRNKRVEFTTFLRKHAREQVIAQKRALSRQEGTFGQNTSEGDIEQTGSAQQQAQVVVEDAEIDTYIQRLRTTFALASELGRLIEKFLDLPAGSTTGSAVLDYSQQFYEHGPPKTHPSAGLSYLRSDAFLDNDALLGPQMERRPLEARVLRAQGVSKDLGKVGAAGVVCNDPAGGQRKRSIPDAPNNNDRAETMDRSAQNIGVGTPGGNRIWVQPKGLAINSRGRIKLETENSNMTTIGIHTGQLLNPVAKRPTVRGFDEMPRMDEIGGRGSNRTTRLPLSRSGGNRTPKNNDQTRDILEFLDSDLTRREAERRGQQKGKPGVTK